MAFNFNLAISLPGAPSGPLAALARAANRDALGEEAAGLSDKEVAEALARREIVSRALKYFRRVTIGDATAAKRSEQDVHRTDAEANQAEIKIIEADLLAQFNSDWA